MSQTIEVIDGKEAEDAYRKARISQLKSKLEEDAKAARAKKEDIAAKTREKIERIRAETQAKKDRANAIKDLKKAQKEAKQVDFQTRHPKFSKFISAAKKAGGKFADAERRGLRIVGNKIKESAVQLAKEQGIINKTTRRYRSPKSKGGKRLTKNERAAISEQKKLSRLRTEVATERLKMQLRNLKSSSKRTRKRKVR